MARRDQDYTSRSERQASSSRLHSTRLFATPSLRVVALLVVVATALVVALPESLQALLLGVGVDVGADAEGDDVEERHPGVLGQELLGKGQRNGRGDPADLHDGHEAGLDGGADLVEGARAGDDSHRGQVDCVLDGGDLQ